MQDITIFSLNNSGDFLKEIIEKSVFFFFFNFKNIFGMPWAYP